MKRRLQVKTIIDSLSTTTIISLFIFIGVGLYVYSLFNGFVADDNVYILQNPFITKFDIATFLYGSSYYSGDISNLAGIYYKPLFTFVVSVLYQLSGGSPFLFHLVQLILHIANSILLFFLFASFFRKDLAFFLALVFLIHPGNVESVVYIANLQEPLYFFFGFLALYLLLRRKEITIRWGSMLYLCLLLATLSKETGLLFLPTIILLAYCNDRNKLFAAGVTAFSVFLTYIVLRLVVAQVMINTRVISPIMGLPLAERLLSTPKIIISYLTLFFFPKNLSWGQHWIVRQVTFADFILPLLVIALLIVAVGTAFFILRKDNKYLQPFLFFLGVSVLGLGLHAQIIPLDFTFADRWLYFPIIGFLGLLGVGIQQILAKRFLPTTITLVIVVLIVSLLVTRSFIRTLNWKDDYTLTTHDITIDPESFVLQNNLGFALLNRKEYNEAKIHFQKSLALYPTQSAFDNLAFTYSKTGDKELALQTYKKSLELGDYFMTYQNYIAELLRQNKSIEAEKALSHALQKYPNNPKLWLLLSVTHYQLGNKEKALQAITQANYLSPGIGNYLSGKIVSDEPITL